MAAGVVLLTQRGPGFWNVLGSLFGSRGLRHEAGVGGAARELLAPHCASELHSTL